MKIKNNEMSIRIANYSFISIQNIHAINGMSGLRNLDFVFGIQTLYCYCLQ